MAAAAAAATLERGNLDSVAVDRRCFDQLTQFVLGARAFVLLTLYQFSPTAWPPLVDALNRRARAGVRVMVVVNRWALQRSARRCTRELGRVLVPEVQLRLWRHVLTNNTHSKYALRDDGAVLVTTSNVAEQFVQCRWGGIGVQVSGAPGAAQAAWDAFRYLWRRARPARCTGEAGGQSPRRPRLPQPSRDVGVAVRWQPSCVACRRRPDAPPVETIHRLIDGAGSTVDIVTPNLSSRDVLAALERAMDRGVVVRAVLARGLNDFYRHLGHLTNGQTARRHPRLEVRWSGGGECHVREGCMAHREIDAVNHSKLLVVDRSAVLVGSSNLDFFSLKHASELNLELSDPSGTFAAVFERFWERATDD